MPAVDQYIQAGQRFAQQQIVLYQSREFLPYGLGGPGVTVTRKVNQVPGSVHKKMIDGLGLAR